MGLYRIFIFQPLLKLHVDYLQLLSTLQFKNRNELYFVLYQSLERSLKAFLYNPFAHLTLHLIYI
ncbi:conserved hypothetical protein [Sphingobacterium multivorum]|uniref:Uncharacterized protein n=1 Tax=Sphingobacterium multivorum TaxID=28454 RepID=A0A654DNQ1_SPHMU|nr:conserved hypothetical protein [Sphingobacterium multivorum]